MLRFLLALLLATPAVGAQTFVRVESPLSGPSIGVVPPASFVTLEQVDAWGETEFYILSVRDAGGSLLVVADSLYRPAGLDPTAAQGRWRRATLGCGTACYSVTYLDPVTGWVSPRIASVIYEDEARGWVLAVGGPGDLLIIDPFDTSWAWALDLPEEPGVRSALINLGYTAEVSEGDVMRLSAYGLDDTLVAVPSRPSDRSRGSAGIPEAPVEVGFAVGNRSFSCPVPSPTENGPRGEIRFDLKFAPNGRLVSATPHSRNASLESEVRRFVSSCSAEPLPLGSRQVNQSTTVTFRFE